MRKLKHILAVVCAWVIMHTTSSCGRDLCPSYRSHSRDVVPPPRWIWVPKYYVYNNGQYTFIAGHYRPVIIKKVYLKRSWKGYTWQGDDTRTR